MLECWVEANIQAPEQDEGYYSIATTQKQLQQQVREAMDGNPNSFFHQHIQVARQAFLQGTDFGWPEFETDERSPSPYLFDVPDENAEVRIRTVKPYLDEPDPCQVQSNDIS